MFDKLNLKEKKVFYYIVIIFFIFFILRLLSGIFHLTDSYEYIDLAKKIRDLSIFKTQEANSLVTKRPFIYPLFLAPFQGFSIIIPIFFQTLLGIYSFFILFKIIEHFGIEIKKKYLWFFIFTPSIFIYSQLLMSEWLVMFFLSTLFWILIQKWSYKNFAYIQIITILLAFTKPVFYPLAYANFIFFTIYFIKKKRFSFWLFLPIIIIQSYIYFNESRTGYRHFSSMENINLINYNLYYFKSKTDSKVNAKLWLDSINDIASKKKSFKSESIFYNKTIKKELRENFFQYSIYHLFGSIRGIFDPGRFDLMTFFKKENGKQGLLEILNTNKSIFDLFKNNLAYIYLFLIPIFLMNIIKWFYFFKHLILKKMDFKIYYIIILLVGNVLISGPLTVSRYMMPFQGVIIVFAIFGLTKMPNIKNKIRA